MELLLNEEQTLLRESATTFTERQGGAARLRDMRFSDSKINVDIWQQAIEAGWLAILASEASGGLGLGLTELCLVTEELGKGLVPEPISAVAATAAVIGIRAGEVIRGTSIVLPALMEGPRAIGDERPSMTAEPNGDTFTLDGLKTGVPVPGDVEQFLVSAAAPEGVVLALVDADDVDMTCTATIDGTSTGSIGLKRSVGSRVAGPNESGTQIAKLLDAIHLSNAAELLGVMEAAQDITLEYLKTREQFDRPIGSFQVLQHRMVDNLANIEMCRSLIYQAAGAMDGGGSAPGLASAALARTSKSALDVCKSAIQMHGGIGFTDEHDIGLYLKRAMTLASRYGNAGLHRKRYAEFAEGHD